MMTGMIKHNPNPLTGCPCRGCELLKKVSPSFRRRYQFFHENGGMLVGRQAQCAIDLARAEMYAEENDWEFLWDDDADGDRGPEDWGWTEKDVERFWYQVSQLPNGELTKHRKEHSREWCRLSTPEGETLASLGGIWDASNEYQRVICAELAAEAISDIERQEGNRIRPPMGGF